MEKIINRCVTYILIPYFLIPIFIFLNNKDIFKSDLLRYEKEVPFKFGIRYLVYCLLGKKEYRSVFIFRCYKYTACKYLLSIILFPLDQIEISNIEIGDGIRIFHKSGCIINAEKIGCNFTCAQGVTIGIGKYNSLYNTNKPIIGNNVWVSANAVIIGGIKIGNNSIIGAGSVVLNDVDENTIVAGNPAKFIRYNREK